MIQLKNLMGHFRPHLGANCKSKAFSRIIKEKLPQEVIRNIYLLRELDHMPKVEKELEED